MIRNLEAHRRLGASVLMRVARSKPDIHQSRVALRLATACEGNSIRTDEYILSKLFAK